MQEIRFSEGSWRYWLGKSWMSKIEILSSILKLLCGTVVLSPGISSESVREL